VTAALLRRDYRPHELAIAAAVALAVQIAAALVLRAAALHTVTDAREIDPGLAVPIRVQPVVDLESPLLKLGGKRVRYKLPDQWVRQAPVPRIERRAFVSPKAEDKPEAIPPKELELSDAGTAPPPDAEVAKEVDQELTEASDAGPSNTDTEGHADGVKEGTEADPLKARAVNLYYARLQGFFLQGYAPACGDVAEEEKKKARAVASVVLGADGTVQSYGLTPSGRDSIDAAARRAMDAKVGQQVPPPPENYPDLRKTSFSVTFVCR
jgi:hypothetical protein